MTYQDCGDSVRRSERARLWREDEGDVGCCDERDKRFDGWEVAFLNRDAVEKGGEDGTG